MSNPNAETPGHVYQEPVDYVDHTKGADLDPHRAEEEEAEAAAKAAEELAAQ